MPSHPDRIDKNYKGICRKCLKNPTTSFLGLDRHYCDECMGIKTETIIEEQLMQKINGCIHCGIEIDNGFACSGNGGRLHYFSKNGK